MTVLLGGESDGVFQGSLTTVETYSATCGLFDSDLPPLPKGRKSFGATYLDGRYIIPLDKFHDDFLFIAVSTYAEDTMC